MNENGNGKKETAPILCVGDQDRINTDVFLEFRQVKIHHSYVRHMKDLGIVDAHYAAPTIEAIMADKGLISSTVVVFPLASGRTIVIGRAIDHWLAWQSAEDLQWVTELTDGVELNSAWSVKINNFGGLYAYLEAINRSHDNLQPVADFTRLACGFLSALGYRQSIARLTALAA